MPSPRVEYTIVASKWMTAKPQKSGVLPHQGGPKEKVDALVAEGWMPQGGIAVTGDSLAPVYVQAIVRPK